MKNVYFISGLGADYRMFGNVHLKEAHSIHLPWLTPHNNETIEQYAARFAAQIDKPHSVVIGLSFGGIMAIEVSKHIAFEKVILISSIKTAQEVPFYYKLSGFLHLDRILPLRAMGQPGMMMEFLFDATQKAEKKLLAQIIRDTDPHFYKWATHKILRWKNTYIPPNLYHIHGTADKVLPILFTKNVHYRIKGGGHIMVYNRAGDINTILNEVLSTEV